MACEFFPPTKRRSDRRPPICVASITLPRSPVSLSSGDEVPHIFTRKSRLQPGEFLVTSAKRLLQQYLPEAAVNNRSKTVALFDHLVGAGEQRGWDFEAERLAGLEVDDQFVFRRCLHRQV